MDKREFAMYAAAIRTYYPREQILPNEQAMALWFREVKDIPFPVAEAALRKWVSTNKWPPAISDIRDLAAEIIHGDAPDWGNAWNSVLAAIRKYGWYNAKAAMDSFDPLTRETVRRLGFRELCLSENITADRANFRMVYETLEKREKINQQMSLPLHADIEKLRLEVADSLRLDAAEEE